MDANSWDEKERRRKQFQKWLVKAWDWAGDHHPRIAPEIAVLVAHAEVPDYPVWEMAKRLEIIGDGPLADSLRFACGVPVMTPRATGWEREINYSPVIKLNKKVWDAVYSQLGWANRDIDSNLHAQNFWLWSNQGNVIRFVIKEQVTEKEHRDVIIATGEHLEEMS